MKPGHRIFPLIMLIFALNAFTAPKPGEPITINPTAVEFDSLPSVKKKLIIYVSAVHDSVFKTDTAVVGSSRTGRKVFSSVICSPQPESVIKKSCENLFDKLNYRVNDPSTANYVMEITIRKFELHETSHFLYQTMKSMIKYDVTFIDPYKASNRRSFSIESHSSRGAFDTTRHAENVMRDAITGALLEMVASMQKLPAK